MADDAITPMQTKPRTPRPTPRRASQREVISIDAANTCLKKLMTEQCASSGYMTVYRGTRQELTLAGIPDEAFPTTKAKKIFQIQTINVCCTGNREILKGSMLQTGAFFELEIDWGFIRPYMQGTHPALVELARMMTKDLWAWTKDGGLEGPFVRLAADPRATDYKPLARDRRFQMTPEFHQKLETAYRGIFDVIYTHGEIMEVHTHASAKSTAKPTLTLVSA